MAELRINSFRIDGGGVRFLFVSPLVWFCTSNNGVTVGAYDSECLVTRKRDRKSGRMLLRCVNQPSSGGSRKKKGMMWYW